MPNPFDDLPEYGSYTTGGGTNPFDDLPEARYNQPITGILNNAIRYYEKVNNEPSFMPYDKFLELSPERQNKILSISLEQGRQAEIAPPQPPAPRGLLEKIHPKVGEARRAIQEPMQEFLYGGSVFDPENTKLARNLARDQYEMVVEPVTSALSTYFWGVPELLAGPRPTPKNVPSAIIGGIGDTAAVIRGPINQVAHLSFIKALTPTRAGILGLAQRSTQSGATLGLVGFGGAVMPSLAESPSMWDAGDRVINEGVQSTALGAIFPFIGAGKGVPWKLKPLKLAAGLAVTDLLRGRGDFTVDDTAKDLYEAIKNNKDINAKELSEKTLGYATDIYFIVKTPGLKRQAQGLYNNMLARKIPSPVLKKILEMTPKEAEAAVEAARSRVEELQIAEAAKAPTEQVEAVKEKPIESEVVAEPPKPAEPKAEPTPFDALPEVPKKAEPAKLIKPMEPKQVVKKPIKQKNIVTWAIDQGGIRIGREHLKGEVRDLIENLQGTKKGGIAPKLLKNKDGLTLDQLLFRAKESGYLNEDAGINDLIDALKNKQEHPDTLEDVDYDKLLADKMRKKGITLSMFGAGEFDKLLEKLKGKTEAEKKAIIDKELEAAKFLKPTEIKQKKPKAVQRDLFGVPKDALGQPIGTAELKETALEAAKRESENRKVAAEEAKKQLGLPEAKKGEAELSLLGAAHIDRAIDKVIKAIDKKLNKWSGADAKNVEHVQRILSFGERELQGELDITASETQKELDKIARQMGLDNWRSNIGRAIGWKKIKDFLGVPKWDTDYEPLVDFLTDLRRRETEITNWAKREVAFIYEPKFKPSRAMVDALYNSRIKGKLTGMENLSQTEQAQVRQIFRTNKKMFDIFRKYMKAATTSSGKRLFEAEAEASNMTVDAYIDKITAEMEDDFYTPWTREKGNHVIVLYEGKEMVWSENFKTRRAAYARAEALLKQFPEAKSEYFDVRQKFKGMDFSTLTEMSHDFEYISDVLKKNNIPSSEIDKLKAILKGEYNKKWAKGRLAKRKGIAGFSLDIKNVLDNYFETFPRSFVRRFNSGKIAGIVQGIPELRRNYAKDLVDYFMGKKDREGRLNLLARSMIYNWNLSLKASFGLLNLTQRGMTTLWKAYMLEGNQGFKDFLWGQKKEIQFWKDVAKARGSSREAVRKSKNLDTVEKKLVLQLLNRGDIEALRTMEIGGRSRVHAALNIVGVVSEKSNRLQAAFTALRGGRRRGLHGEKLFKYVTDVIEKTQWLYGKQNRPRIGRGLLAMPFVFKTYIFNDINFMADAWGKNKKAFAGAMATRIALGGVYGIYGAGLVEGLLNVLMGNILGKDDWELTKRETADWLKTKIGARTVDVMLRGAPTLVGIEGSTTFGSAELFDVAAVPLLTGFYRDAKVAFREGTDKFEIFRRRTPAAIRHVLLWETKNIWGKEKLSRYDMKRLPKEIRERAYEIYDKMPTEMSSTEKVLYALGFSTTTPSDYYRAVYAIKESSYRIKQTKSDLHRAMGDAIAKGDYDEYERLKNKAIKKGLILDQDAIWEQVERYREASE